MVEVSLDSPHLQVTPPRFEDPPCFERDALFFSVDSDTPRTIKGYRENRRREHQARLVCRQCPFRLKCALHGLEFEEFGIWGGLTERDRQALGGTGKPTAGAKPTRRGTVKNLAEAGFEVTDIKQLLGSWDQRRKQIERDRERGAA